MHSDKYYCSLFADLDTFLNNESVEDNYVKIIIYLFLIIVIVGATYQVKYEHLRCFVLL